MFNQLITQKELDTGHLIDSKLDCLQLKYVLHFVTLWSWPFDLILNGQPGHMAEYPCGKFGDCSFSRFGSIMQTDRHKHTHTYTQMPMKLNALLPQLSSTWLNSLINHCNGNRRTVWSPGPVCFHLLQSGRLCRTWRTRSCPPSMARCPLDHIRRHRELRPLSNLLRSPNETCLLKVHSRLVTGNFQDLSTCSQYVQI